MALSFDDLDTPATTSLASRDISQTNSATDSEITNTIGTNLGTKYGFFSKAAAVIGGAVPDLVDQVSSSVGLTDRGEINDAALNAIGSPGLRNFYDGNKGAIEVGSGVASLIGSHYAAKAFLNPAGAAMRFAAKTPYVKGLAALERRAVGKMEIAKAAQLAAAKEGAIGFEQYTGNVALTRLGVTSETSLSKARNAAIFAGVKKGFAQNLAMEGILLATANTNSMIMSNDMSENLLWAAGGLSVGGLLDTVTTKYAFRKFANDDIIKRAGAKAYDPYETESARLHAMQKAEGVTGDMSTFGFGSGIYTDAVVSLKLSVQEGRNPEKLEGGIRNKLFGRRQRLATQQDKDVRNFMQKTTTSGINGVGGTSFSMTEQGFGNHLDHMSHKDPTAMMGMEEVGRPGPGQSLEAIAPRRDAAINAEFEKVYDALTNGGIPYTAKIKDPKTGRIFEKKKYRPFRGSEEQQFIDRAKRARFMTTHVEVRGVDGEWVSPQVGDMFSDFIEPDIFKNTSGGLDVWEAGNRPAGKGLAITGDLNLLLPKARTINTLGLHDSVAMYRIANQVIESKVAQGANRTALVIPKKANWFQLDMAERMIQRAGDENAVRFVDGFDRESAMVESFRQKAAALRDGKVVDLSDPDAVMAARYRFNLPRLTAAEQNLYDTAEHPIEVLLRGMGDKPDMPLSYQELLHGIEQARGVAGMVSDAKTHGDKTLGNMFQFGLDDKGHAMQQFVAWKRPLIQDSFMKDNLAERLAMGKAFQRQVLTGQEAGEFTSSLTRGILSDEDFVTSAQVDGLQDIQLMPATPGLGMAAPQTNVGRLLNDLSSKEWTARDQKELLSLNRVQRKAARAAEANYRNKAQHFMGDVLDRLVGPRNGSSLMMAQTFASARRGGWELKTTLDRASGRRIPVTKPTTLADGRKVKQYVLDETSLTNQQQFQKVYGRPLAKDQVMLTGRGAPVVLDDLGEEFFTRFQAMAAQDLLKENNTFLKAAGLGDIAESPMFVPPPSTKGKYVAYTLDSNNKPVRYGTIIADTPQDFAKQKAILESDPDSPLLQPGHQLFTEDDVRNFLDITDQAQMNWIQPGTIAAMPGKKSTGVLTNLDTNLDIIGEMVDWARDRYLDLGRQTVKTIYKDAEMAVRQRAAIARESKLGKGGRQEAAQQSIYDIWLGTLNGTKTIDQSGSIVGSVARPIVEAMDPFVKGASAKTHQVTRAALDYIKRFDFRKNSSQTSIQQFNKLRDELGPYMPFKSAAQFAEKQFGTPLPADMARLANLSSQFESAMRLRLLESMHAVMNMAGVVAAMPAVIRFAQKLPGELDADWAARTGHFTQQFALKNGEQVGVFDMAKLMQQTLKSAWNIKSHPEWDYMMSRGFVTQEVAELQKQMGVLDTRGGLKKFFSGDNTITNPKNKAEWLKQKGAVGFLSVLSDKSEDLSRAWSHMSGLKLADVQGIVGQEARHSFAHDFANKVIANYDPANRPAIFQGALGVPLGLFQSFQWAYYQRMFRYLETGSHRALATQYATQSALFGITGVPGFQQINELFFANSDGENSPYDAIAKRFGPSAGDALMAGTLSNLPRLANLLPGVEGVDGINLYSRGDVSARLPGIPLIGQAPPIVDTIKRVVSAFSDGVSAFSLSSGIKGQRLAEITSNMLTNRPMAGFIESFMAGGYDTDRYGQVVAESKGFMENAARVIGVRGLQDSKDITAFYATKAANEIQAANMASLNKRARSAIRAGDAESLPGFFEEYVAKGGDPARFNSWMKRNMQTALKTRSERMLETMSKNPIHAQKMQRLIESGVSVSDLEDEELNPPMFDATNPDGPSAPVPSDPNESYIR